MNFQDSTTTATALSDCHKMTITAVKQYFPKQSQNLKLFNKDLFRRDLTQQLRRLGEHLTYTAFEDVLIKQLNKHVPMKEKYVRANNAPFMNKKVRS